MNMGQETAFQGAKLALFLGGKLAVILRDNHPGLPFPGFLDLPGGGREGDETPWACAQRECREELGLKVPQSLVVWKRAYPEGEQIKWFFVARIGAEARSKIVFGDEGQRWTLMTPEAFMRHPKAVLAFQARLGDFLREEAEGGLAKKGPPLP